MPRRSNLSRAGFTLLCLVLIFNPFILSVLGTILTRHQQDWLWLLCSFIGAIGLLLVLMPRNAGNWFLGVISAYFSLALAEVFLQFNPEVVGYRFSNYVLHMYHFRPEGIYYRDDDLGLNLMKPDFEADMYWNGHRWHHRTDSQGFRNAGQRRQADIILVGDSFVYGHGVEANQTIAHYLEDGTGRTVYTVARQGDYIWPQRYFLETVALPMQPRLVVHFFFLNDLDDYIEYHSMHPELIRHKPEEIDGLPAPVPAPERQTLEFFNHPAYVISLLRYMKESGAMFEFAASHAPAGESGQIAADDKSAATNKATAAPARKSPVFFANREKTDAWNNMLKDEGIRDSLAYYHRSLAHMIHLTRAAGAEFLSVPIVPPEYPGLQAYWLDFYKEENLPYVDLWEGNVMHNREEYFLPLDGHFNPAGNRRVAELINDWLLVQGPDSMSAREAQ